MKKIDAVIFDMGNVLIDYTPDIYARQFTRSDDEAALLTDSLFCSPEWAKLDRGDIEIEEALLSLQKRMPQPLYKKAELAMHHWHEHVIPRPSMESLVRALKADGFKLYLLSNASKQFETYSARIPALALLDGLVVSAFEHMSKPERGLYELFHTRYGLALNRCLFIDDMPINVDGAIAAGMLGYYYDDQDETRLRQVLGALGANIE